MKRFVSILVGFFVLSLALASQQLPSSPPPSGTAISSLEQLKQQLLSLQQQILSSEKTIASLTQQLSALQKDSEADKQLSIKLQGQLLSCQTDLANQQTLYNKLSTQFQSLSVSFTIEKQLNKTKTYVIIGLIVVAVAEGAVIAAQASR